MSKGGSSAPSGPQEVIQTSSNLPEYAKPYFTKALERSLYESTRPYEAFPGQRIADFTPQERSAMQGMEGMASAGSPEQFLHASNIAKNIGYQPSGMGMNIAGQFQPQSIYSQFDPQAIQSQYRGPDIDPGYGAGDISQDYRAGQFDPGYTAGGISQDYQAGEFDPGYQARDISQGYQASQRTSGYTGRPEERFYPMGMTGGASASVMPPPGGQFPAQQGQFGPGFTPGTVADPETIERYMSPYQQMVTDVEKREARRQSDIAGSQIGQQAAQTGGMGGYREAIMQAERERNLGQQLGDIQTRGSQAGFQQAQQAFEADRAARLQAGQLGLQVGGARESALQAGERFGQQQFMTNEQLRQQQQQAELGAYQAGEGARQRAGAMGMTAQQAEDAAQRAQQQAQLSAYQAGEQARQQQGAMGMTAQQAEDSAQRAQQQAELSAYQAGEQARQQAGAMGMTAQEIEDRGRQAADQARLGAERFNIESQRQADEARLGAQRFNIEAQRQRSELGLRGLGADQAGTAQRLDAARMLGGFGQQQQQMDYERLQNLQAAGEIQRQLGQQGLTMGYQDFLRQQAFPREQLGMFNQMLRGLPIQPGSTQATYGGPSSMERMLGSGIAGVGLYNQMRR
jgi:hypothetical protein